MTEQEKQQIEDNNKRVLEQIKVVYDDHERLLKEQGWKPPEWLATTTDSEGKEQKHEAVNANYMQIIPDSQWYTALEEIEASIMAYTGGGSHGINLSNATYMLIAIRNTIKQGCYICRNPTE